MAENGPIVRYYLVFPWKWALVLLIPVSIFTFIRLRRRRQDLESLELVAAETAATAAPKQ